MVAIIVSPTPHVEPGAARPISNGPHRLVILHAEHDEDDLLVQFARRVEDHDRVTLANLRPVHHDVDALLDLRIAARSRLLDEMGIAHDAITATYVRSTHHAATARGLRSAIGRVSHHARADNVVVGPGAILELRGPA